MSSTTQYLKLDFKNIRTVIFVVEPKFVCLMHSGTTQTEMLEFGAEKGLLQEPASSMMGGSEPPVFREEF